MTFDLSGVNEDRFQRPIQLVHGEDEFKEREVGLNHPDTAGFIRLKNNGDIEIVAGEGVSIILHPAKRSITFVADSIKFLTRDHGGLRWNNNFFNERAGAFHEPTLIEADDQAAQHLYKGVEHFLFDDIEDPDVPVGQAAFPSVPVADPETGDMISYGRYYEKYGRAPTFGE